jgi:AraC-like DNA-binding protein
MIIALEGKKIIHSKEYDIHINSNEICFLAQNNYFMSERTTKDMHFESLLVYFNDQFIFDMLQKYNIEIDTSKKKIIAKVPYLQNSLLQRNISLLQAYMDKDMDQNLLKLKIEELILHSLVINKDILSFIKSVLSTSQNRIKFILESNIDMIQTIEDMAKLTRLTYNQLRRYVKQEYDLTPKVWLDTKRLEKAMLMLKNSEKTITEISTECGYSTVSWFISQFKKKYHRTPKEFRYKT